jgi:hypothetical protein
VVDKVVMLTLWDGVMALVVGDWEVIEVGDGMGEKSTAFQAHEFMSFREKGVSGLGPREGDGDIDWRLKIRMKWVSRFRPLGSYVAAYSVVSEFLCSAKSSRLLSVFTGGGIN